MWNESMSINYCVRPASGDWGQNWLRLRKLLLHFWRAQHCFKSSPDRSFISISLCNYIPSLFSEIDFKLNNCFRQSHGFLHYDWYREAVEQEALINLWTTLNKLHILLQGRFTATADLIKCFIKQNMGQMSN